MQTLYFTTSNFIRHEGNVVDLTEYRRKLAIAQGHVEEQTEAAPAEDRPVCARTQRRRALLPGMMLDYAASAALVVTALTFAVKIL